jgi:opacity protein-like surface antigen
MKRVLVLVAALALSSTALAQQNNRSDTWQFDLVVGYLDGDTLSGENGSSIETDNTTIFGLAINYNFNSHWALGGELTWGSPDYDAVIIPDDGFGNPLPPQTIRHEMDLFSYMFKGTFNLLEGPITPYAELGFGWTEMDSNVADQPPITGCWWDPWWGYICNTYVSTFSKTRETLTGALGIRMDLGNGMTLKGSYGMMRIDTSRAAESAEMNYYRLDVGWRF